MRISKNAVIVISATIMILLAACTNSLEKPERDSIEGNFEILWDVNSGLSPDLYAIQALKAQFPDAAFHATTFEPLDYTQFRLDPPLNQYDLAENNVPGDLIFMDSTLAPYLFKTGYLEPLDNYIRTDLSITEHLEPWLLDSVREQGDDQVYGIPFGKNVYALYYNTEIFNEMNLPAPTNGMTWEEVFDLAWQITESPLRGSRAALRVPDEQVAFSQFDIRVFNPETGQPFAESPLWEKQKEWMDRLMELEESNPLPIEPYAYTPFMKKQLAMIAGRYIGNNAGGANSAISGFQAPIGEGWDMVGFPVFADAPDTGPAPTYYYLGIPKNSHHKTEAFRMISFLLSEGPQTDNSRNGLASVLNDADIDSKFGELDYRLTGHHVQAFFAYPKEGSYDPEYDLNMQLVGKAVYWEDGKVLDEIMNYRRGKLEKVGVSVE
ncbi:MAG: extracellular solute-binding protein [Cohnella sp.]|nr:extracellular solute-binding protein [Cohnella sp.]